MNIKAQGLLNAGKWIEETRGPEALAEVLAECPLELRQRYETAIAIEWHPMSELCDFIRIAARVLGLSDRAIAREVGAVGARSNTRGIMKRALFYLATPNFLLKRIAGMWSQFNDRGSMKLSHLDDEYAMIEVTGVPEPDAVFCGTLTGWVGVIAEAVGLVDPVGRHVECRARGDERCAWKVTWGGMQNEVSLHPPPVK